MFGRKARQIAELRAQLNYESGLAKARHKDLRPDWRDPDMLVLVSTKYGRAEWTPDRLQRACALKLWLNLTEEPNWRDDPTYHLRKDHKR